MKELSLASIPSSKLVLAFMVSKNQNACQKHALEYPFRELVKGMIFG